MNVIQEQDNVEEEHLETKKQITEKMVAETENSIGILANKRPNSPENRITCQTETRKDKQLLGNTQKFSIYLAGVPEREERKWKGRITKDIKKGNLPAEGQRVDLEGPLSA